MTVSSKVQQVIASLQSAAGSLQQFALDTNDQGAKRLYQDTARQCEQIVNALRGRLHYMQQEEPQYRG